MDSPGDAAVAERRLRTERRSRPTTRAKPALRVIPPRAADTQIDPGDLKNPALYINRELSWLEFNQRVLAQATDPAHPLLERVKFLSIVGTNLDEFFMIRVATTQKKLREGIEDVAPDGYNTEQQLYAMRSRARKQIEDQATCWNELRELLAAEHIRFLERDEWTPQMREFLGAYFSREICPVLTPLAFDPGHPFPLISNLSKNFAVVVRHGNRTKFARVKLPDVLPRFIQLPENLSAGDGQTFVFLEDVIHANMQELFPGTQVKSAHLFRVIRDADLEIEQDEADDLLETVDRSLKQLRHGAIALLQVDAAMPARVLNILAENFEVTEDVILRTAYRVGFGDWMQLTKVHRPELKYPPFSPRALWRHDEDPEVLFDQLRYQDVLVHLPYQSFGSVEALLQSRREGPTRHRDQDDALPDRRELAVDQSADPGGRSRQAGRGAGGAQGALRRAEQHHLGEAAGIARHPCGVRLRRPEDARQAVPRRAAGRGRHPAVRAHEHRQLQPGDGQGLHRPRVSSPPIRRSSATSPTCSTT